MLIRLRCSANVKKPDGGIVTIPMGNYVNYSSKPRDGTWIHKFSCLIPRTSTMIYHTEEMKSGSPNWL